MHTLIKVLATSMLMGLFSTNAMAWVDCWGLPGYVGYGKPNEKSDCKEFQMLYGNTDRDWHSKTGRYTRKAGVDYRNGGNSSANSKTSGASQSVKKKVVKKSRGQSISESSGLYAVIIKYGMKDGLAKIRAFWIAINWPPINLAKVEKHLTSISWTTIEQGAEKFAIPSELVKFLKA